MYNFSENKSREECAKLFLPQNQNQLEKLTLDELNKIEKNVLGCENLKKFSCSDGMSISDDDRRYEKFYMYHSIYSRYNAAFNLCDLLNITDIYDIGCAFINQSFLLIDKPNISYTGIDADCFSLLDYRNVIDATHPNYHCPATDEIPSFCDGRIRFLRSAYPFEIHPKAHHLVIAFHSLAFRLPDENSVDFEVRNTLERIESDFDRLLITIGYPFPIRNTYEYLPVWKRLMPDYDFYRIEHNKMRALVFATKIDEDIKKLCCAEWFPTHTRKIYTNDGMEIKIEYDFSLEQFHASIPLNEFTFVNT